MNEEERGVSCTFVAYCSCFMSPRVLALCFATTLLACSSDDDDIAPSGIASVGTAGSGAGGSGGTFTDDGSCGFEDGFAGEDDSGECGEGGEGSCDAARPKEAGRDTGTPETGHDSSPDSAPDSAADTTVDSSGLESGVPVCPTPVEPKPGSPCTVGTGGDAGCTYGTASCVCLAKGQWACT